MFTIAIEMTILYGGLGHGTDTETKSRLCFWLFRIVSSFDFWLRRWLFPISRRYYYYSLSFSRSFPFFIFSPLCLFSTRDDAPCQKGSFLVLVSWTARYEFRSEWKNGWRSKHRGLDVTRDAGAAARRISKHYLLRIRCSTRAQLRNSLKANIHEI